MCYPTALFFSVVEKNQEDTREHPYLKDFRVKSYLVNIEGSGFSVQGSKVQGAALHRRFFL